MVPQGTPTPQPQGIAVEAQQDGTEVYQPGGVREKGSAKLDRDGVNEICTFAKASASLALSANVEYLCKHIVALASVM